MSRFGEKKFLPVFSVLFLAVVFLLAGGSHAKGAGSCTATVTWNPFNVSQGQDASETWFVSGAVRANGVCTDGAGVNDSVSNLNFGPQSFTYRNIQKNITCTVNAVALDGSTCTSGPQTVTVSQPGGGGGSGNGSGGPFTGSFPSNGSYTLSAKSGTLNANLSYAQPVPTANFILWPTRSFYPLLGDNGKGLFGTAIAAPGPAFRWDVSDPLNMKGPEVVDLTHGPSGGSGPISNIGWAHVDHWNGSAVAESPEGDARYSEHLGLSREVAVSYDGAGGQGSFGGDMFGMNSISKVVAYTSSGKFFAYGNSGSRIGNSLGIYDLTDLSGSATEDIQSASTISWSLVGSLITLNVPSQGQFLIGISNSVNSQNSGTLRIGKINPDTGKLTKDKSYQVTIVHALTTGERTSYLQAVTYKGKGYIFILESIGFGNAIYGSLANNMVLSVYELNPSDASAKKLGTITVNDLNMSSPFKYKIAGSPRGDVAPLLIVPVDKFIDVWDGSADLRAYGLRKIFSESQMTLGAGDADFVISKTGPAKDASVKTGDIVVNQMPFNAILASQNGKTYLNLFRNAYIVLNGAYLGNDYPYGVYGGINVDYSSTGALAVDSMGKASIRADRIDVTSIAGTGGGSGSGGGGTGGGGEVPTLGSGTCYAKYPNNVALRSLCEQIEAIKQDIKRNICPLRPDFSICSSL